MNKIVAVIVPNPVNGYGLFSYLETFFENGVKAETFAVSTTTAIKTNSGVSLNTDKTIAELKGKESNYDGVVFACGDAIITLGDLIPKQEYKDMIEVLRNFNDLNKKIAGHCAAGLIFEKAGITKGKKISVHPLAKAAIVEGIAVDSSSIIDANMFTAKDENNVPEISGWFTKFL